MLPNLGVDEELVSRHLLVRLDGALVQERKQHPREVDQRRLQKLVRLRVVFVALLGDVEVGDGNAVGPVRELG